MALKKVGKLSWRPIARTPVGSSVTFNKPAGMSKDEFAKRANHTRHQYKSSKGIDTKTQILAKGMAIKFTVKARDKNAPPTLGTKSRSKKLVPVQAENEIVVGPLPGPYTDLVQRARLEGFTEGFFTSVIAQAQQGTLGVSQAKTVAHTFINRLSDTTPD